MQTSGCSSTKNIKKEPSKNYDDCIKIKREYNDLLNEFNKLSEIEKDCYKLNRELVQAAQANSDLIRKLNHDYKTAKTNQVIAIVIACVAVTFLAAGGIAIGVKLNK